MKKEIEVKLTYNSRDKEKIKTILSCNNAKLVSKYNLHDTYFSQHYHDMSNAHNLLRVRTGGNESELTFKGKCETEGHIWERLEASCKIASPENIIKILKYLGFNIISENKSIRELWNLGSTKIVFIDFVLPDKIDIIEVEADSKEEVQKIVDLFCGLVSPIGEEQFKKFDESRKSKTDF